MSAMYLTTIFSVYKITNLVNGKHYVGFTTNPDDRWYNHQRCSDLDKKNTHLYNAMRKYGVKNFKFEILYQSMDYEHTHKTMETYFIKEYDSFNNGYNMTLGGEGSYGREDSPETTVKRSIAKLGKKRPPMTQEQKDKISASKKNKPWTEARLKVGYKRIGTEVPI